MKQPKLNLPVDRTVYLTGDVLAKRLRIMTKKILKLDESEGDIYLIISSIGGEELAATAFYELMKNSLKNKLVTVAVGDVMSSATIVYCAGHKRIALKNSFFYVHAGWDESRTDFYEFREMNKSNEFRLKQLANLLADNSNIKSKKWIKYILRGKMFTSKKMLKTGIATEVI